MRNRILAAVAAVALLLPATAPSRAADGFYGVAAAELAGRPGSIIRAEKFNAPPGASAAYRVIYRSTAGSGKPVAVSGVVVIPNGAAPRNGRPVVSWAPATSGIAQGCARSMYPSLYTNMYGMQDMLAKGMIVAATDYPGLGVSGSHPYLIGEATGRAVLDMARAARALPDADASNTFVAAGYSQGGHAALYAGNMARAYAPELKLAGIAAAAPPTDLGALIRESGDDPIGRVFATYALAAWSKIYGLSLDDVLAKPVRLVAKNIAGGCNMEFGQSIKLLFAEQAFEREGFLQGDVTARPRWKALLAKNSPGPTPAGVPVFLAQGTADHLVRPSVTQVYAEKLCARGTRLTLVPVRGGHGETGGLAAKPMAAWIADRFAGKPAPSDCGAQISIRAPGKAYAKDEKTKEVVRTNIPIEKRFYLVDSDKEPRNGRDG